MKLFQILFFVGVALIYVKADELNIHELAKECQAETGASDDDVTAMIKQEPAGNTAGKCLKACVMKKLGVLDDNAHFNKENALKVVKALSKGDEEKEKVGAEVVEACADIEVPEDHCEAAETYKDCMRQHAEGKNAPSLED